MSSESISSHHPSVTTIVGLGGNLGNVAETFDLALKHLDEHREVSLVQTSPLYTTTPVGSNAGSGYVNAAATIETTLAPEEFLSVLQETETLCHRKRDVRWGPRTLDLDLIAYGDQCISTERLIVPHPACFYRRFVLDPVIDIAPDWRHPIIGLTARELHLRLKPRPLKIGISCDPAVIESLDQFIDDEVVELVAADDPNAVVILASAEYWVDSQTTVLIETETEGEKQIAKILEQVGHDERESRIGQQVHFILQILVAVTDSPTKIP
ncbi:2-amino-4-hydroxy-6-hydroxymethyldihydropteridine diphosphokinase [Thalassoglobus sp. JC818]|uniref:2-amino-4-hydroxy-6- hydroxymethyldihydropteridine diphosphokinase n=1 Tax=Thalassoglobus sp. JC818 TaxID=3232136 RepID=UPI00345AE19E